MSAAGSPADSAVSAVAEYASALGCLRVHIHRHEGAAYTVTFMGEAPPRVASSITFIVGDLVGFAELVADASPSYSQPAGGGHLLIEHLNGMLLIMYQHQNAIATTFTTPWDEALPVLEKVVATLCQETAQAALVTELASSAGGVDRLQDAYRLTLIAVCGAACLAAGAVLLYKAAPSK
jgi:hypothetical protein